MVKKIMAHSWAWKWTACIGILSLFSQHTLAQQEIPTIKATSKKVDVKDGNIFQRGVWNLSPELNPDVFFALKHPKEKIITFYTDIDSISFHVEPGQSYDFIILLNDTDSCFTRIESKKVLQSKIISPGKIEPELLREDFSILINSLQREHGGLFRYKNQSQLRSLSDSLFQLLNEPMNPFEFSTIVGYLLTAIQDGHTGGKLPQELMNHYAETVKMFPLQLWFIDEKAYVICEKYEEIPIETEILSIDGKLINEVKKKLFQYLPSDGVIESKKYWILNHIAFPFLYNWVFGEQSDYAIKYKTPNGQIRSMSLKGDFISNSKCYNLQFRTDKNLQLEFKPDHIAVLTISSFDSKELMRTDEDYSEFMAASFKEINDKKVEKLIIDLRNNAGGDDAHGALLYSYLTSKPFRYHSTEQLDEPQKLNFKGKVYFLINGLSFSTTSNVLAIARSNNRGVFIGEETGGAYYGCTSGETFKTVLPNSHIRIAIPKNASYNPVKPIKEKDRGVVPDYNVIPNVGEVLRKEDIQLRFALKLASQK